MTAGNRDTLITFERANTTQDDYGEEVPTWATLGTEWAAINWGRGDERRQAGMEQGSQSATFTVYDNQMTRSVSPKDRLKADDAPWDITSNVPSKTPGDRDITAVRST